MHHDPAVDVTPAEIAEALRAPADFGLASSHPLFEQMFVTWSLGPVIHTRDEKLLQRVNAEALLAHLKDDPSLKEDYQIIGASHWAGGWVDHLAFRAVEADGTPTRIFRVLKDWNNFLADYPCADDTALSQAEYDAAIENIGGRSYRWLNDEQKARPSAETSAAVWRWLWDHDQRQLDDQDGEGAYPSDESIKAAVKALGWLEEEDDE